MLHSQRTPTVYNFNFGWQYEFPHQSCSAPPMSAAAVSSYPFSTVDLNRLDLGTIGQYQSGPPQ